MGSVVAGAGVNPADQRWGFWPLLPLSPQLKEQLWEACSCVVPGVLCKWAESWATGLVVLTQRSVSLE